MALKSLVKLDMLIGVCLALGALEGVLGFPTLLRRQSITDLSPSQIAEWTTPAYYASAAYCPSYTISNWNCGSACGNLTAPSSVSTGGDGGSTPRWFVASTSYGVVVSISGTNTSNVDSYEVDIDYPLTNANETTFPNSNGVQLHRGFYGAFGRMQSDITAAVQGYMSSGTNDIVVVGHSLGAALAQMMGTYLQKQLSTASVTVKAFAPPRGGNKAWANYVDATLGSNTQHMINWSDDVPHLPPQDWGFQHASGEIWIQQNGTTYEACPGQENPQCSDSLADHVDGEVDLVTAFLDGFDKPEHRGPYAGVTITSQDCTV